MGSKSSIVQNSKDLFDSEKVLQVLFKEDLKNKFKIGEILCRVKELKLYRYKDAGHEYSWDDWTGEFMGSRRTAERFISFWDLFIRQYKLPVDKLQDIPSIYLEHITSLLLAGKVPEDEIDDLLERAKTSPSIKEFKQGLIQKEYSLEELHEEKGHEHDWKEIHIWKCKVCEKISSKQPTLL